MPIEIERKFLVDSSVWNHIDKGQAHYYRQGYILTDPAKTIRIRVTDTEGFITIKGISTGATRLEYEYTIPKAEAIELLDHFCNTDLAKHRYKVLYKGKLWEVDEFLGSNEGLIVAEIELSSEQESFDKPDWVAAEVTGQEQYYNSNLSMHPFQNWHNPTP